jgi:hypothetical protein
MEFLIIYFIKKKMKIYFRQRNLQKVKTKMCWKKLKPFKIPREESNGRMLWPEKKLLP